MGSKIYIYCYMFYIVMILKTLVRVPSVQCTSANGIVVVASEVKKRTNALINCIPLLHLCIQIIRSAIKLVTSDIIMSD